MVFEVRSPNLGRNLGVKGYFDHCAVGASNSDKTNKTKLNSANLRLLGFFFESFEFVRLKALGR